MKRFSGLLAVFSVISCIAGVNVYAEDFTLGDVDNNADITAVDALVILQSVTGMEELSPEQFKAADVDGDNQITSNDALKILQYVTKIIDDFKQEVPQTTEPPQTTTSAEPPQTEYSEAVTTTEPPQTSTEPDSSSVNIWSVVTTETPVPVTDLSETTTVSSSETTTEPAKTTTTVQTTTELPQTTTTVQTTTEPPQTTTEAQLPRSYKISNVTPIVQSGLPTGCEATGLTIALRWYGFGVSKEDMALKYMPWQDFVYKNGKKIGPDYIYTFAGDPRRSTDSYGCYIPCMMQAVKNYFDDIGCTNYTTTNISGTSLDSLFNYVANGTPVILISTNNLITPTTGNSWYTPDGRYITWQKGHHCMVLTGYDYSKNVVYVSESAYSYERTYNMDSFRNIYNLKGKNAMIIRKTNDTPPVITPDDDVYVTPFADGDICTLKNYGSGKMLNVDYGKDQNDTNVYQWTNDNSTEQKFKMNLMSDNSYMIRTMCSSDGTNRTLDIVKSNGNIVSGGNVDIYNPTDTIAQRWLFVKTGTDTYKIVPKYNTSLALTVCGNSNGTGTGTTASSAGNAFVSTYTGSAYQQWTITKIN